MDEVGDAEPRVRRVLPSMPPLPVPLWLTTHRELRTSRRIRAVFDLLADALTKSSAPSTPSKPSPEKP
jgi:DNA-binding transcriptional LysR family regulator